MLIILYRFLMVCHSDYCLNMGEQRIREKLLEFCTFAPLVVASLSMFFLDQLRDNNMCNGREEVLRFNINNFLQPVFYNEFVVQLPLYHPFTLILLVIGRSHIWFNFPRIPNECLFFDDTNGIHVTFKPNVYTKLWTPFLS